MLTAVRLAVTDDVVAVVGQRHTQLLLDPLESFKLTRTFVL